MKIDPGSNTCSCGNSLLLTHGEQCELCMGQVSNEELNDLLPEWKYDEKYFDEMEAWFGMQRLAA